MADNPLTTGPNVTSGAGENSTSPPQSWDAAQLQIQKDFLARQAAEQAAVEAANARARNAPGGKLNVMNVTRPKGKGRGK